jgi:hypothetical protein
MQPEEMELNFDASCQQILGLESEILREARITPSISILPRASYYNYILILLIAIYL